MVNSLSEQFNDKGSPCLVFEGLEKSSDNPLTCIKLVSSWNRTSSQDHSRTRTKTKYSFTSKQVGSWNWTSSQEHPRTRTKTKHSFTSKQVTSWNWTSSQEHSRTRTKTKYSFTSKQVSSWNWTSSQEHPRTRTKTKHHTYLEKFTKLPPKGVLHHADKNVCHHHSDISRTPPTIERGVHMQQCHVGLNKNVFLI